MMGLAKYKGKFVFIFYLFKKKCLQNIIPLKITLVSCVNFMVSTFSCKNLKRKISCFFLDQAIKYRCALGLHNEALIAVGSRIHFEVILVFIIG